MSRVRLGIVGCGRWGMNHVRTAAELKESDVVVVCDQDARARQRVAERLPSTRFVVESGDVAGDSRVQAVVIATPAETHFAIAQQMLAAGKDILVEKPITLTVAETRSLVQQAEEGSRILMVGHILLYHPAVRELKRRYERGDIGRLQYMYSNRLNLGAIRSEENILWSFAPHDISVIQHLVGVRPDRVRAMGATFVQNGVEDTTITYLDYPDNVHAHIFVSWLHPFKEQRLVVIGDKGMFVFDDTAATDKLRFSAKGFSAKDGRIEKFDEAFTAIPIASESPLAEEHRHFYRCVEERRRPLTDGNHALEVMEILEAAQRRLHD